MNNVVDLEEARAERMQLVTLGYAEDGWVVLLWSGAPVRITPGMAETIAQGLLTLVASAHGRRQVTAPEAARELALQAAASIRAPVSEVVRRPKSLAWILGRLRKRMPGVPDAELRAAVRALPRERFEVAPAPAAAPSAPERPTKGRESATADVWRHRAQRLAGEISYALRTHELIELAEVRLRWSRHITQSALSAGEDLQLLRFGGLFWTRIDG